MDLDIAVIGGGVSGAYSAWRLQQALGPSAAVGLFEYSDRIGGRLFTVTLPGLPNVKAEIGGMRYIPDQHIVVANLINHLHLATKDFPMGAPPPLGANCNLFYLRGKHLRLHELADPAKVPYNLAWSERGLGPTNLQVQVMNAIFPNMSGLSLCDLMRIKTFGKPLWQYGFWDLMYRVLSNEGYQFMRDAGGYDANVANANAVTQLPATEYSDQTKFLTLRDGYDRLPIQLAHRFNHDMDGALPRGGRVFMNHRLAELECGGGDYPYTLHFEPTATTRHRTHRTGGHAHTVRAKKVILAMPRRSLELIKGAYFDDPWLKKNLPSVLIQHAFKLFLAYERPWWRTLGLVAGRSVTDLPIRQVYYFGTEGEQPGGEPFLNSLLMASYNDISTVPFWKGLQAGEDFRGYVPSCHEPGVTPANVVPRMEFMPTDQMVEIAHRQVAEVHAVPQISPPYSAVYHDWSADPYGGGWHEWKSGYRLDQIMCQMRKPVPSQDVYVCGEAYSYLQGWVEGALDTAESLLQDFFGLERPHWLPASYALMPNPCPGCEDLDACVPITASGQPLSAMTPNCCQPVQVS